MATDSSLLAFKAISTFVTELSNIFGEKQRPLKLLSHLISKTTLNHFKVIERYATIFKDFCIVNRDAILTKDSKLIKKNRIVYSERLYIDFTNIFKSADNDTKQVIWRHLLLISAHLDPESNAKQVIKSLVPSISPQQKFNESGDEKEAEFVNNLMSKIEGVFGSTDASNVNPQEAIMKVMQTGLFSDIMSGLDSGLKDGSLDLQKLLGTVQGMVSNAQPKSDGSSNAPPVNLDPMSLMSSLMGSLNSNPMNASQDQGRSPVAIDFESIAAMIGPLMSGMNAMQHAPSQPQNDLDSVE